MTENNPNENQSADSKDENLHKTDASGSEVVSEEADLNQLKSRLADLLQLRSQENILRSPRFAASVAEAEGSLAANADGARQLQESYVRAIQLLSEECAATEKAQRAALAQRLFYSAAHRKSRDKLFNLQIQVEGSNPLLYEGQQTPPNVMPGQQTVQVGRVFQDTDGSWRVEFLSKDNFLPARKDSHAVLLSDFVEALYRDSSSEGAPAAPVTTESAEVEAVSEEKPPQISRRVRRADRGERAANVENIASTDVSSATSGVTPSSETNPSPSAVADPSPSAVSDSSPDDSEPEAESPSTDAPAEPSRRRRPGRAAPRGAAKSARPKHKEPAEVTGADTAKQATAEVTDVETAKVADVEAAEVTDLETAEVTDEATAEVTDVETAEVTDVETAEVADVETAEVTDVETVKVANAATAEVTDTDTVTETDTNAVTSKQSEPTRESAGATTISSAATSSVEVKQDKTGRVYETINSQNQKTTFAWTVNRLNRIEQADGTIIERIDDQNWTIHNPGAKTVSQYRGQISVNDDGSITMRHDARHMPFQSVRMYLDGGHEFELKAGGTVRRDATGNLEVTVNARGLRTQYEWKINNGTKQLRKITRSDGTILERRNQTWWKHTADDAQPRRYESDITVDNFGSETKTANAGRNVLFQEVTNHLDGTSDRKTRDGIMVHFDASGVETQQKQNQAVAARDGIAVRHDTAGQDLNGYHLVIIAPSNNARMVNLHDKSRTIGRGKSADIKISDPFSGRMHAEIYRRESDGAIVLRDLNSQNGTYINGTRITGEVVLNPTDRFTIGDHEFGFGEGTPINEDAEVAVSGSDVAASAEDVGALDFSISTADVDEVLEVSEGDTQSPPIEVKPGANVLLGSRRGQRFAVLGVDDTSGLMLVQNRGTVCSAVPFPFNEEVANFDSFAIDGETYYKMGNGIFTVQQSAGRKVVHVRNDLMLVEKSKLTGVVGIEAATGAFADGVIVSFDNRQGQVIGRDPLTGKIAVRVVMFGRRATTRAANSSDLERYQIVHFQDQTFYRDGSALFTLEPNTNTLHLSSIRLIDKSHLQLATEAAHEEPAEPKREEPPAPPRRERSPAWAQAHSAGNNELYQNATIVIHDEHGVARSLEVGSQLPPTDKGFSVGKRALGLSDDGANALVSREHGFIRWNVDKQLFEYVDDSLNGTYIQRADGGGFEPVHKRSTFLSPGDQIRLGSQTGPKISLSANSAGDTQMLHASSRYHTEFYFDGRALAIPENGEITLDDPAASEPTILRWETRVDHDDTVKTGWVLSCQSEAEGEANAEAQSVAQAKSPQFRFLRDGDRIRIGTPAGPELKMVQRKGHSSYTGEGMVFLRKNGERTLRRGDGTTEVVSPHGARRLQDRSSRVVMATDTNNVSRNYTYDDATGKLRSVDFSDGSNLSTTDFINWSHTSGDITDATWTGSISVETDGSLRFVENRDKPFVTVQRVDGITEKATPRGRRTYTGVDFATERARMESLGRTFDHPAQQQRFLWMMQQFEMRARNEGLDFEEMAHTYFHLRRLMEEGEGAFLSPAKRRALAEQILHQTAFPKSIDEGVANTCNVVTIEKRIFTKRPSEAVRLVADVSNTGRYVTSGGDLIDLTRVPNLLDPDTEARRLAQGFRLDRSDLRIDGRRTYASQIFETAAVNIKYAMRDGLTEPIQIDNNTTIGVSDLTPVHNAIVGGSEEGFVIQGHRFSTTATQGRWVQADFGADVRVVSSTTQLEQELEHMSNTGKLPAAIAVHASHPFFNPSPGEALFGHFINVHAIYQRSKRALEEEEGITRFIKSMRAFIGDGQPLEMETVVEITNQWGLANNRIISVDELFRMTGPAGWDADNNAYNMLVPANSGERLPAIKPPRDTSNEPSREASSITSGYYDRKGMWQPRRDLTKFSEDQRTQMTAHLHKQYKLGSNSALEAFSAPVLLADKQWRAESFEMQELKDQEQLAKEALEQAVMDFGGLREDIIDDLAEKGLVDVDDMRLRTSAKTLKEMLTAATGIKERQAKLAVIDRLITAREHYVEMRRATNAVLDRRKRELQALIDSLVERSGLPASRLLILEIIGESFVGGVSLNDRIRLTRADLMNALPEVAALTYQQLAHNAQQSLIFRRLIDQLEFGIGEPDVDTICDAFKFATGHKDVPRGFVESLLKARGGQQLTDSENVAADALLAAWRDARLGAEGWESSGNDFRKLSRTIEQLESAEGERYAKQLFAEANEWLTTNAEDGVLPDYVPMFKEQPVQLSALEVVIGTTEGGADLDSQRNQLLDRLRERRRLANQFREKHWAHYTSPNVKQEWDGWLLGELAKHRITCSAVDKSRRKMLERILAQGEDAQLRERIGSIATANEQTAAFHRTGQQVEPIADGWLDYPESAAPMDRPRLVVDRVVDQHLGETFNRWADDVNGLTPKQMANLLASWVEDDVPVVDHDTYTKVLAARAGEKVLLDDALADGLVSNYEQALLLKLAADRAGLEATLVRRESDGQVDAEVIIRMGKDDKIRTFNYARESYVVPDLGEETLPAATAEPGTDTDTESDEVLALRYGTGVIVPRPGIKGSESRKLVQTVNSGRIKLLGEPGSDPTGLMIDLDILAKREDGAWISVSTMEPVEDLSDVKATAHGVRLGLNDGRSIEIDLDYARMTVVQTNGSKLSGMRGEGLSEITAANGRVTELKYTGDGVIEQLNVPLELVDTLRAFPQWADFIDGKYNASTILVEPDGTVQVLMPDDTVVVMQTNGALLRKSRNGQVLSLLRTGDNPSFGGTHFIYDTQGRIAQIRGIGDNLLYSRTAAGWAENYMGGYINANIADIKITSDGSFVTEFVDSFGLRVIATMTDGRSVHETWDGQFSLLDQQGRVVKITGTGPDGRPRTTTYEYPPEEPVPFGVPATSAAQRSLVAPQQTTGEQVASCSPGASAAVSNSHLAATATAASGAEAAALNVVPTSLLPVRSYIVGRADAGQADITIDSNFVSGRHAELRFDEYGNVVIRDLGSTNGTYVNGQLIAGDYTLRPGDVLTFGDPLGQPADWENAFSQQHNLRLGNISLRMRAGQSQIIGRANYNGNSFISGKHASVGVDEKGPFIRDEGSTNGSIVVREGRHITLNKNGAVDPFNGEVFAGAGQPFYLRSTDEIWLGGEPWNGGERLEVSEVQVPKSADRFVINAAPPAAAQAQSNAFSRWHELEGPIQDGFHFTGQNREIDELGKPHWGVIPITVIDKTELAPVIQDARARFAHLPPQERAVSLAQYVRDKLTPAGYSAEDINDWYIAFMDLAPNQRVSMGRFLQEGKGACAQKALLFKVLGDEMGLNVTVIRGNGTYGGIAMNHIWTTVDFGDGPRVFDPHQKIYNVPTRDVPSHVAGPQIVAQFGQPGPMTKRENRIEFNNQNTWVIEGYDPQTGETYIRHYGTRPISIAEMPDFQRLNLDKLNNDGALFIGEEYNIRRSSGAIEQWRLVAINLDGSLRMSSDTAYREVVQTAIVAADADVAAMPSSDWMPAPGEAPDAARTRMLHMLESNQSEIESMNHTEDKNRSRDAQTVLEQQLDKLKRSGEIDKAWELFPTKRTSAAQRVGWDYILLNVRTGAMHPIDVTTRATKITTPDSMSIPLLCRDGVVHFENNWFDPAGGLKTDDPSPQIALRAKEFPDEVSNILRALTRRDTSFVLGETPFPDFREADLGTQKQEIANFVNWLRKKADTASDTTQHDQLMNYAFIIEKTAFEVAEDKADTDNLAAVSDSTALSPTAFKTRVNEVAKRALVDVIIQDLTNMQPPPPKPPVDSAAVYIHSDNHVMLRGRDGTHYDAGHIADALEHGQLAIAKATKLTDLVKGSGKNLQTWMTKSNCPTEADFLEKIKKAAPSYKPKISALRTVRDPKERMGTRLIERLRLNNEDALLGRQSVTKPKGSKSTARSASAASTEKAPQPASTPGSDT